MRRLLNFIRKLFNKAKPHHCYGSMWSYYVKANYKQKGNYLKGGCKLLYNVYEVSYCDICNKRLKDVKVATNIPKSRLYNKFGIDLNSYTIKYY